MESKHSNTYHNNDNTKYDYRVGLTKGGQIFSVVLCTSNFKMAE